MDSYLPEEFVGTGLDYRQNSWTAELLKGPQILGLAAGLTLHVSSTELPWTLLLAVFNISCHVTLLHFSALGQRGNSAEEKGGDEQVYELGGA